jgi:hypothetical protein
MSFAGSATIRFEDIAIRSHAKFTGSMKQAIPYKIHKLWRDLVLHSLEDTGSWHYRRAVFPVCLPDFFTGGDL